MPKAVIYLLIQGDAYCFGELLSMLRRQQQEGIAPRIVGVLSPIIGKETIDHARSTLDATHLLSHVDAAGAALNSLIADQTEEVAIFINSDFIPANTVWFDRLLDPIRKKETEVVIGRIVHDLYTNWLIQNDYGAGQSLAHRNDLSPFYFQHANFAVTRSLLTQNPFPNGSLSLAPMRWAMERNDAIRFVADAALAHLSPIIPAHFIASWRRYSGERFPGPQRFGFALRTFFGGVARDCSFALSKRAPQWLFYSLYLRTRQSLGILLG